MKKNKVTVGPKSRERKRESVIAASALKQLQDLQKSFPPTREYLREHPEVLKGLKKKVDGN